MHRANNAGIMSTSANTVSCFCSLKIRVKQTGMLPGPLKRME